MQLRKIEDISLDWLNQAMFYITPESGDRIKSFHIENVGVGMGFVNQIARIVIEYESDIVEGLRSIIVKCPPLDKDLRSVSDRLNNVRREVTLYKKFDLPYGITIPKLYYGSVDEPSGNGVLVIEDIDYAVQGDSVLGCSYEDAVLAITEIAKFHAYYSISSNSEDFVDIPRKDDEILEYQELFQDAWKSLVHKAGTHMPPYLLSLGDKLERNIYKVKAALSSHPITLIHGDFRLDNCFFIYDGLQQNALKVIDWEYCAKSRGTYDIATFISEAFNRTDRRNLEWQLVELYYSNLKDRGVINYSLEECYRDYRISMLEILIFWVISGGFCDYSGPRATEYLNNSLLRFSQAVMDLRCEEFLT